MRYAPFFAGAVALGLALGGVAFANSPVKDWEVGPINAPSSSGVGYCSMKNFYQSGHGLVIARDAEGSSSIAISFREKELKTGGQYTVGVRADDVSRQMVGLAATPQVLILQMSLDRQFYEALQKKNSLEIDLNGKELNFSLDSTQDAVAALTKCSMDIAAGKAVQPKMIALRNPLQEGPVILPEGAGPVQSIGQAAASATLQGEIERLKIENQRLLAENQAAAAKLIASEKEGTARALAMQAQPHYSAEDEGMAAAKAAVHVHLPPEAPLGQEPDDAIAEVAAAPAPKPVIIQKKDTFLQELLQRAKIPAQKDGAGYSWSVKDLFGAAEERTLPQGGIRKAVDDYVAQAKSRCDGDFAHNESKLMQTVGGTEILEGEFACIGGENDAAAALLFVARDGKVNVISHEGTTEQMEDALSKRAALISNITR